MLSRFKHVPDQICFVYQDTVDVSYTFDAPTLKNDRKESKFVLSVFLKLQTRQEYKRLGLLVAWVTMLHTADGKYLQHEYFSTKALISSNAPIINRHTIPK
jgi:hypothetical protein